MPDELVEIYDDSMKKIGVASRYEAHAKGWWHFNFHCWVVSRQNGGTILFQVRSAQKPSFPGMLDSTVGGHYRANERSSTLLREIKEEIGIKVTRGELVPLGRRIDVASYGGVPKREIANVFFLEMDLPFEKYRLDEAEVGGLVGIRIASGLELFSGQSRSIPAKGVGWNAKSERWETENMKVGRKDFVPKADSYYLTLFIMAKRFLAGEKYVSI